MTFDIASLFWGNEGWEEGFEAIGYDLGDDFVEDVAKGNWPKLVMGGDTGLFGDEGEKGGIKGWENLLIMPRLFHHLPDLIF